MKLRSGIDDTIAQVYSIYKTDRQKAGVRASQPVCASAGSANKRGRDQQFTCKT